jgi:excisionase family DNA binding protein
VDPSTPEELSLEQAAELLGYNAKTLRRLIKAGKLRARLKRGSYRIHRSDVWHILYDRHDICDNCLGIQRSARLRDFKISQTDHAERWVFDDWGAAESCEELPDFEVTLSVAELRRVLAAIRRRKTQIEYDVLRTSLRNRIKAQRRQSPQRFSVVLKLDDMDGYELCKRVFRRVKARPKIPGVAPADLESEAVQHLLIKAMPHLMRARNTVHYLSRALANFYKDIVRREGIGSKGAKKRAGHRDESVDLEGIAQLGNGPYEISGVSSED